MDHDVVQTEEDSKQQSSVIKGSSRSQDCFCSIAHRTSCPTNLSSNKSLSCSDFCQLLWKGWGNCPTLNVKLESWSNAKLATDIQPVSQIMLCVIFFFFLKSLATDWLYIHVLCRMPLQTEILTESMPRIWTLDSEACMHFWTFFFTTFLFNKNGRKSNVAEYREIKIKNLSTHPI